MDTGKATVEMIGVIPEGTIIGETKVKKGKLFIIMKDTPGNRRLQIGLFMETARSEPESEESEDTNKPNNQ